MGLLASLALLCVGPAGGPTATAPAPTSSTSAIRSPCRVRASAYLPRHARQALCTARAAWALAFPTTLAEALPSLRHAAPRLTCTLNTHATMRAPSRRIDGSAHALGRPHRPSAGTSAPAPGPPALCVGLCCFVFSGPLWRTIVSGSRSPPCSPGTRGAAAGVDYFLQRLSRPAGQLCMFSLTLALIGYRQVPAHRTYGVVRRDGRAAQGSPSERNGNGRRRTAVGPDARPITRLHRSLDDRFGHRTSGPLLSAPFHHVAPAT